MPGQVNRERKANSNRIGQVQHVQGLSLVRIMLNVPVTRGARVREAWHRWGRSASKG